jgi:hypothetical protein
MIATIRAISMNAKLCPMQLRRPPPNGLTDAAAVAGACATSGVAIKLLPPQLATDHAFVVRFRREADPAD